MTTAVPSLPNGRLCFYTPHPHTPTFPSRVQSALKACAKHSGSTPPSLARPSPPLPSLHCQLLLSPWTLLILFFTHLLPFRFSSVSPVWKCQPSKIVAQACVTPILKGQTDGQRQRFHAFAVRRRAQCCGRSAACHPVMTDCEPIALRPLHASFPPLTLFPHSPHPGD